MPYLSLKIAEKKKFFFKKWDYNGGFLFLNFKFKKFLNNFFKANHISFVVDNLTKLSEKRKFSKT